MTQETTEILKWLWNQWPAFALMSLFIVMSYLGRIRFEREVLEKDKVIDKLTSSTAEAVKSISDSVKALDSVSTIMKEAVASQRDAVQQLERARQAQEDWNGRERRRR